MSIKKYKKFKYDILLESALNESTLYFTTEFRNILNSIDDPISKNILSLYRTDLKSDKTFIDISDKSGFIKFSQMKNSLNIINKFINPTEDPDKDDISNIYIGEIEDGSISTESIEKFMRSSEVLIKSRNEVSLGKFINSILPKKYKDSEIETFVNKYKSLSDGVDREFEIISGVDIVKWYNLNIYYEESGDLGNSCMRYISCSTYFKIYTENPETCRLLILKKVEDGVEKLLGRALVWNISNNGIDDAEFLMDRVYGIDDSISQSFFSYAVKNAWVYKKSSNFIYKESFIDTMIIVKLNKFTFDKFPYMDTFKRLDINEGLLMNDEDHIEGCFILESTSGGYQSTDSKWSEYYAEYIDVEDAVWSNILEDWIMSSDSIEVEHGSSEYLGFYPSGYDNIVHDDINSRYLNLDDCSYSDYDDTYILEDDSVEAITYIESISYDSIETNIEYISDSNYLVGISDIGCYDFLKNELGSEHEIVESITSKYSSNAPDHLKYKRYLDVISCEVYKTNEGNYTKDDCVIFNIESGSNYYYTDQAEYNYSPDVEKLVERGKIKLKEMKYILDGNQTRMILDDDVLYIEGVAKNYSIMSDRVIDIEDWISTKE